MPILAQYHRLELPEFPRNQIIFPTQKNIAAIDKSSGYFIRPARLDCVMKNIGLRKALEIANAQFELVAQFCGGQVVDHTFGLTPAGASDPYDYRHINGPIRSAMHPCVPNGYMLAAKVEVIPGACPPSEEEVGNLENGIAEYLISRRPRSTDTTNWCLSDAHTGQFVRDNEGNTIWADIEPQILPARIRR